MRFDDRVPPRPLAEVRPSDYPDIPAQLLGALSAAGVPPGSEFPSPVRWGTDPGCIDPHLTAEAVTANVRLGAAMFGQALGITDVGSLWQLNSKYKEPYELTSRPETLSWIMGADLDVVHGALRTAPGWGLRQALTLGKPGGTVSLLVAAGLPIAEAIEEAEDLRGLDPVTHMRGAARVALKDWQSEPSRTPATRRQR